MSLENLVISPALWFLGLPLAAVSMWLTRCFSQFLPSPERTWLAIKNVFRPRIPGPSDRFRFVLCWLEDDPSGSHTMIVARAFTHTSGIDLVRSAQVVKAEPAARDEWQNAIGTKARAVLQNGTPIWRL